MADKWWKTEGVLGEQFARKADLEQRIRAIVAQSELGKPIAPEHQAFMLDVLRRHHEWEGKRGAGVAALVLRRVNAWSGWTTGFFIQRTDGTEIDISWVTALMPGGGGKTVKTNVALAARYEVVEQRNAAVAAVPDGAPCVLCGQPLARGDRHVDHAPPVTFDWLLDFWLTFEEALNYRDVAVEEVDTGNSRFADRALAQRWQDYHAAHARLRVIHKHENLRRAA